MSNWLQLILPNICVLCGNRCNKQQSVFNENYENNQVSLALDLCSACQQELPVIKSACAQCAAPLPIQYNSNIETITNTSKKILCGACLKISQPFAKTIAPYFYHTPIDHLIAQLKFQKQLVYARILGLLLANFLLHHYKNRDTPQIIIPIPLHKYRLKERGFNQSLEIAKPISKLLNIPINIQDCIRSKNTEPQSRLHAKERQNNIHNAFSVTKKSLTGKYVAVIDDVITTGYTRKEFCTCLQRAGACKIDVWACAHA